MTRSHPASPAPRGLRMRPLAAALAAALGGALVLGACSSGSSDDERPAMPSASGEASAPADGPARVEMAPVATVRVPAELTGPTGIAWHAPSAHFVVVTDSGQVATIDGERFELVDLVASGLDALDDVTAGEGGELLALAGAGTLVALDVDAAGTPTIGASTAVALDAPATGIAFADPLDGPALSVDGAAGPVILEVEGGAADAVLELDAPDLGRTASLAVLGDAVVLAEGDAATLRVFDLDGTETLTLGAGGLGRVAGLASRDGTVIVAGTDAAGEAAFVAYDFQNAEEVEPDPADGPATLETTLARTGSTALPDGVRQPSGLAFDAATDSWLVATDQGELVVLDEAFADVRRRIDLPGFGQGEIEDLHLGRTGEVLLVAEDGGHVSARFDGTTWTAAAPVANPAVDVEVSAVAYRADGDTLHYVAESGPGKALITTARDGTEVTRTPIDASAVGLDSFDDYTVSSLVWTGDGFLVLSERYSTVFEMDADAVVTRAYGLDEAVEASGLALAGGELVVAFDHEDSAPVPPLGRYARP